MIRQVTGNAGMAVWWFVRPLVILAAVILLLWVAAAAGLSTGWLILILLLWVLPVIVGWRLCNSKDRDGLLALAVFLGWVGVLIAVAVPAAGRRCPACDEMIRTSASICRFCGSKVTPFQDV